MIKKGLFMRELVPNAMYFGTEDLKVDFDISKVFDESIDINNDDYNIFLQFHKNLPLSIRKEIFELLEIGFKIELSIEIIFSSIIIKFPEYNLSIILQKFQNNKFKIFVFENH